MNAVRFSAAAMAAFFAVTASGVAAPASRGFSPADQAAEARYERIVDASPSQAQALRDEMGLASYVHRMGQPGDLRSAKYVRAQLAAAGWDANLVEYIVPLAWPYEQKLTLLTPVHRAVDLYEPAVAGDPYSKNHAAIGIPYSGYSRDGDVTGRLVYANHATPDDFKALASQHVDVRGAIIVARSGLGSLTGKAFEGAKHGASAVLVFNDPMNGGYWNGDTYPKGPWRPAGAAMRNTMTFTNDPGDPTAIGIPVPGAKHRPFSAIKLPAIPEMPITADVARELLRAIDGPAAPAAWHPGFGFSIHLGRSARAHFILKSKRFFGPMWDVIATMQGQNPAQMVVTGGHRDAWTYGAVDPISGTVDLLQLGRAFGKLKRMGWKPKRTIVIGSWDGEELNLFGSDIWVSQNEARLRAGCIAYMNTDEVAFGPRFNAYATPDLYGMLRDAADAAHAPNGEMLDAYWRAQDPKMAVDPIGGGSDHEPFVYHENLPGAGAGYGGPFGSYHSAYDDVASLRIFDPGMRRAAAAARYSSMVVLRLADASYPDLRLTDLAQTLAARITQFAGEKGETARRATVASTLELAANDFVVAAKALDARADADVARGDETAAASELAKLRAAERAFYDSATTKWQRSLLYDVSGYSSTTLPTLETTLDSNGEPAQHALEAAFKAATQAASSTGEPSA
ncbi:MAG: M28 family peptidase [Candidatus Eremiobacteraeota bacterium]|nr:M28 family peptidase [Candidatus Eremiobacteraeota bacterium]